MQQPGSLPASRSEQRSVDPPITAATTSTATHPTGLQLPPPRAHDAVRRDLVLNRILPSEIHMIHGTGRGWEWFDGDTNTALASATESIELTLRHESTGLEGVRVRGPATGTLTVLATTADRQTPVGTPTVLRIADGAWQSVNFATLVTAPTLTLRWEPAANVSSPPSEIELWAKTTESLLRPHRWLADRLATTDDGVSRRVATPANREIAFVERAGDEHSGEFVIARIGDGLSCSRAFLQYELDGAPQWSAVEKTINGASLGTPQQATSARGAGVQLEEFSPALLGTADIRVRFLRNLALGAGGYRVQNLSLLCVQDSQLAALDREVTPHALTDDDRTTGMVGATPSNMGPLNWTFANLTQPHALSFYLSDTTAGTLTLRSDGQTSRHRISLAGRSAGWNSVFLPDTLAPASSVWIEALLDRESTGRVAEVRLAGSLATTTAPRPELVVTYPHHGECVDSTIHVRGFLRGVANAQQWTVRVLGQAQAVSPQNVFALSVTRPTTEATELEIVATNSGDALAERISTLIPLARCQAAPLTRATPSREDVGAPFAMVVQPERASVLDVGDFRVEIPRGAVARETRVTLRQLAASELPPLEGLTNVTRGARAYRMGPHPMQFLAPVKLTIPVQSSLLAAGKTLDDVSIYYFDDVARRWREVARDVTVRPETVTATTDHFTDFIAATGVFLDNGEGGAGDQNSMGSAGGGNPLAGVTSIAAPQAGPSGDANTGFALRLPPGRRGMQPQLSLQYSSATGNGFAGVGWSLPLSAITIDTRFGVPNYLDEPTYLLDGQPLLRVETLSPCRQRFEPRVLGGNTLIVRDNCSGPAHWTLTDTSGTVSTFGGSANSKLCAHPGATLSAIDADGRIPFEHCSTWSISDVQDLYGNYVSYVYEQVSGNLPNQGAVAPEPWVQMYPKRISYTGHRPSNLAPYYHVLFSREAGRNDVQVSARSGFVVRTDSRLTHVTVLAGGNIAGDELIGGATVRRYALNYITGEFEKSLLSSLVVYGNDNATEHYRHSFDYIAAGRTNNQLGYQASRTWAQQAPEPTFDNGNGEVGGISGAFGIGDPTLTIRGAIGLAYQRSGGHTSSTQVDINGDGLPDFFGDDGRLWLNRFANPTRQTGQYQFVQLDNVQTALQDEGTNRFSLEGSFNIKTKKRSFQGALGATASWSWTRADRMLSDVDGDGLIDLINGPVHLDNSDVLPVRTNPFAQAPGTTMFGQIDPQDPSRRHSYTLGGLDPIEQRAPEQSSAVPSLVGHPKEPLGAAVARRSLLFAGRQRKRHAPRYEGANREMCDNDWAVRESVQMNRSANPLAEWRQSQLFL